MSAGTTGGQCRLAPPWSRQGQGFYHSSFPGSLFCLPDPSCASLRCRSKQMGLPFPTSAAVAWAHAPPTKFSGVFWEFTRGNDDLVLLRGRIRLQTSRWTHCSASVTTTCLGAASLHEQQGPKDPPQSCYASAKGLQKNEEDC